MQDVLRIADKAQSKWANDYAGREVPQNRTEAQPFADRHRDDCGDEINDGLL